MNAAHLKPEELRATLVALVLEWERRYGVAPAITSAISEYDAARIVGHTAESFGLDCNGRTAVTRGADFCHNNIRYQVKANRPSGKPGSFVTLVSKAKNYEWDRLIWLLYDRDFRIQEAWEWTTNDYRARFDKMSRLSPKHMRMGRSLPTPANTDEPDAASALTRFSGTHDSTEFALQVCLSALPRPSPKPKRVHFSSSSRYGAVNRFTAEFCPAGAEWEPCY